ncbi:hypothetical protein [Paenibacillus sacheonensis]|uniref:Uncharacterized protein n=1 Tax=Paenibacillus sacheonensis TaxID=742054 RepID=A0A7X4YRR1_9BACL|nr:hypothetical protein [Paenibacillus sacheonensis]MBM7566154.1 hypothetical protein [Paenibacillus sacheonensis]NBC70364.1 hypothetical protein [Paenibacillus sacheonensis]
MNANKPVKQAGISAEVKEIIVSQEQSLEEHLRKWNEERRAGGTPAKPGLGHLALGVPLYCHPESRFYGSGDSLPEWLSEAAANLLASQLPSGNISLANCNIDSPPDTAFAVHLATQIYRVSAESGLSGIAAVQAEVRRFLERALPALLTGGIHTPNHRWVMAGALADLYELFEDERLKERAFQFLDEGFDMTEYGEWTERSNAIYNGACAVHLYSVGKVWGFEPAFEAIRRNLHMMRYLLHPGDTVATEYSGRQDNGQTLPMNEWYYTIYHLMANLDGNPEFAAMAAKTERTAPRGSGALMHWMLMPDKMKLPEPIEPLSDDYTILFGENNRIAVPDTMPYVPGRKKHPHGAAVLRHRRGRLSVTAMAAQPDLLYVQYGEARMFGLRIAAGWFGIAGVAFPSIRRTGEHAYVLETELEGCYWGPLSREQAAQAGHMWVDMPNYEQRVKTNVQYLPIAVELTLLEDGVDLRFVSERIADIYLQAVCQFDAGGTLEGDGLEDTAPHVRRLAGGEALFRKGDDCLRVSPGACEHGDALMRNDKANPDAINMTINWLTPADRTLRIRGFGSEGRSR